MHRLRRKRDACDGVLYTGDMSKAPCPGDSTIRCCVTFENMNNGTNGDGSSNSSDSSSSGLTGSQIGGIVGGVVGGVIVLAALFLIFFFGYWRKRQRDRQIPVEIPSGTDRKEEENSGQGRFMSEVEAREVGELDAGNERRELDGHGQAVYELEGVSPVDGRKR
ncbi:hypothetical protein SI65_05478 [Aspergillus cristatus]|uniref:Mid2 domain-containing protein n=1 Tax=Aspergillus cristatus TaxID=573508 RepID=A0A1E3BDN0_ASPCR|nr:hypothetical protein SI65_05478 [Aspergillus cristatus]